MFHAIYGISVFTHLSEEYQVRWLRELSRILRPHGTLLLTVHGARTWHILNHPELSELKDKKYLLIRSAKMKRLLPDWYQTSFQTRDHMVAKVGCHLRVLDYMEGAMGDQDAIIAERR